MARTSTKTTTPAPEPKVNEAALQRLDSAATELVLLQDQASQNAIVLAQQLGYEGALSVGALEDGIRFYQRRTVEAILETGRRLLVLRELFPKGNSQNGKNAEFETRVGLLGFSKSTAYRFMQAATKTAKSAILADLSKQAKNGLAFLELVTHGDDELESLAEMDNIDRMSASQLREALRQSEQDIKFSAEKREKAEQRADTAEKKLAGKRPVVVPLDERITPFTVEITERQSLAEKAIAAHLEAAKALDAWWLEEVTQQEGYDPEQAAPMPRSVGMVVAHLFDSAERLAALVGRLQHDLDERFGADIAEARQYLMQEAGDAAA